MNLMKLILRNLELTAEDFEWTRLVLDIERAE